MINYNIYIDTASFIAAKFNFSHPSFLTIERAVVEKKVRILVNTILKNEFIKHYNTQIDDERRNLNSLGIVKNKFTKDLKKIEQSLDTMSGEKSWDIFNEQYKCANIDCDIDWRKVFDKYFSNQLPFEDKKNKKSEFPDAFAIEILIESKLDNIVVISQDGGLFNWAKSQEGVIAFRSIGQFTNYYLQEEEYAKRILKSFQIFKKEIEEKIINDVCYKLSEPDDYLLEGASSEIEDVRIKELKIVELEILNVNSEEDSLEIELFLEGTGIFDISSSVYIHDSVDKEEIYWGTNNNKLDHDLIIRARATVVFEGDDLINVESYDVDSFKNWIEIPSDWESILDYDEDDA